ncbi:MAG: multifunctional 2-oxoglutarate metabolism enzyme, partial [Actinomycetota bacterium]|nr:multifunctional 2-oxoglutarate metabolism enzyme [Actinomycetota bacterium]
DRERLDQVMRAITSFPEDFEPHPKLRKQLEKRADILDRGAVDWAAAESLAFGSLLLEGTTVRLSGQDSRRGTFSQRHSVLMDHRSAEEYFPLNNLGPDQAPFRVFDSLLSELAVVGFEYGYSVANGDALVAWEAQFGDFVNGAQPIVDHFVVAGEDKWRQTSGLVMLLPHGYEGQGPDHSSARLERFLTLAAEDSIQVVQPTTAAQYFHVLRRQMHRTVRKPLIVMTPKSLLRARVAQSTADDLVTGHFKETLDDRAVEDPENVRLLQLCTGKIGYALMEERSKRDVPAAVVRLEQLYPFPLQQLQDIFDRYPMADEVRWVQEEPENMGAWFFVQARLHDKLREGLRLSHASRAESASPASGSLRIHEQEHAHLMEAAFEGLV